MKPASYLLLSALVVGMAYANLFAELPSCASTCFEKSLSFSTCNPNNIPCLCDDAKYQGAVQVCLGGSCNPKELLTTTNTTYTACGLPTHDKSSVLIGIAGVFGTLAILVVLVRVCARLFINKFFAWDDRLIVASLLFACPLNFLLFPMARNGMGKDIWTVPFDNLTMSLKDLYFAEIFYMISEMFTQLSILAFYLRVFPFARLHTVAVGLMVFAFCFGVSNAMAMIFQCTPVSYLWNGWTGEVTGHCIDINLFSWIRASFEIAMDLSVISLPIPSLLRLSLSWNNRIQILVMFSVGFLITLVSILRLKSLIQFAESTNITYDNAPAVYWSVLECDIAIICASMPAVRIVLGHIFPALFGSNFQTGRVRAQETPNSDVTALQPGTQMSSATAGDLELNLSKQRASSERSDSPSKEQPSETYLVE